MIFMLPMWYLGFIHGVMVGIMLSGKAHRTQVRNEHQVRDEQLERIIQKNKHRIIGL
jgi:hypothetical protein